MEFIQLPREEVRICVAEDNRINRKVMVKLLSKFGYTNLDMYENGLDAIEGIQQRAAEGEPYHLVFMDVKMPVMDGKEASKLIRMDDDEAVRSVPIIGMDASAESFQHEIAEFGWADLIRKPIQFKQMAAMVETHGNPPRLVETTVAPEPEPEAAASKEAWPLLRPRL